MSGKRKTAMKITNPQIEKLKEPLKQEEKKENTSIINRNKIVVANQ